MSLQGWIKVHRSILDHWVSMQPETLSVWIRMLSEANHAETKKRFNGSLVEVGRGQLIFGLNAFSDKTGISISKLRRIISELESDNMISRQITSKYSIITITCYEKYQGVDSQDASEQQANRKRIASEQQHRKNVKNGNNENNEDISPTGDVPPKKTKSKKIELDESRIVELWNSLGCVRHNMITKVARASIDKSYKEYCKAMKQADKEPLDATEWIVGYLKNGFAKWMTDHHRQLNDGQWAADLEFAMRPTTYEKVKSTVVTKRTEASQQVGHDKQIKRSSLDDEIRELMELNL